MKEKGLELQVKIPEKFGPIFKPRRFKVYFGGRGGAKTESYASALILMGRERKLRVLCLREFMNSIDDSVHAVLRAKVEEFGMQDFFEVKNNEIVGRNGTTFKYAALSRNLASIKSKHAFDIAWVEEAETIKEASLDVLIPTIRKAGSELWFSFNPGDEFGPVYSTFVTPHLAQINATGFFEDDEHFICKVNLEDNPFAPPELITESVRTKETNYRKWLNIWRGEPVADYERSIIRPEWFDAAVDAHLKLKGFEMIGVRSLGFDLADEGSDSKAVMMRHGSVIVNGEQWFSGDLHDCINRGFGRAYEWRADAIVYDADGLGAGVKVGLDDRIEGKNITVTPYHGNDAVDNPAGIYKGHRSNKDTFRNKRAQYFTLLADRFEATYNAVHKGIYTNPEDMISISSTITDLDVLKSECVRMRRKKHDSSYIQMESKKEMEGASPGMLDALNMCFANQNQSGPVKPIIYKKRKWK